MSIYILIYKLIIKASLVQLVERMSPKYDVEGSIPSGCDKMGGLKK